MRTEVRITPELLDRGLCRAGHEHKAYRVTEGISEQAELVGTYVESVPGAPQRSAIVLAFEDPEATHRLTSPRLEEVRP